MMPDSHPVGFLSQQVPMWVELLYDESLHCVVVVCSGAVATVSDGHCGLDLL